MSNDTFMQQFDDARGDVARIKAAMQKPVRHPKDHEIASLVNRLRDIAIEFHGQQQLRERIAHEVVPMFARTHQPEQAAVSAEARIKGMGWQSCSVKHARRVLANPSEWPDHEVRLLYTQQAAQVVPEGWTMHRESPDVIIVQHPAIGSVRCVIPPTTHHGHMLFMLCDDILGDANAFPAASQHGEGK